MQVPPKPEDSRMPAGQREPQFEMLGATGQSFVLQGGRTEVSFTVHAPRGGPLAFPPRGPDVVRADGTAARIVLKFEAITSRQPAPALDVYVNLGGNDEPGKHPERFAGRLPMFGLIDASKPSEEHPGEGLHHSLDITKLYGYLARQTGFNGATMRVTFVPKQPTTASVRMGRVSLFIT